MSSGVNNSDDRGIRTIAECELERLRDAVAWSPLDWSTVAGCRHNQHASKYLFADGSILRIWAKGAAAIVCAGKPYIYRARWHNCTAHKRVGA